MTTLNAYATDAAASAYEHREADFLDDTRVFFDGLKQTRAMVEAWTRHHCREGDADKTWLDARLDDLAEFEAEMRRKLGAAASDYAAGVS